MGPCVPGGQGLLWDSVEAVDLLQTGSEGGRDLVQAPHFTHKESEAGGLGTERQCQPLAQACAPVSPCPQAAVPHMSMHGPESGSPCGISNASALC